MKPELEKLIQAVLQDGVVTAKEREVLHKKAEALGEDPDEVDIYLDAELQKKEQTLDAAKRQRMSRACPYCGGGIPQLAEKCPHCGENITAAADKELVEIIENLEEALVNLKAGKDFNRSKAIVERYSRKAKLYYSNNPKVKILLEEVSKEVSKVEKSAVSSARIHKVKAILNNESKSISGELIRIFSILFMAMLFVCLIVFLGETFLS